MKNLNKKIGAVALAGSMLIAPGLSQEFVTYANSTYVRRSLLRADMLKDYPQGSGYRYVEGQQYKSNYNAIYLGNSTKFNKYIKRFNSGYRSITIKRNRSGYVPDYFGLKPNNTYFYLRFKDGFDFLTNIHKLNPYRRQSKPIIINVDNDFFSIFFEMSTKDRNVLPLKQFVEPYDFKVVYAHDIYSYNGMAQMQSHIINRIGSRPDIDRKTIQELLKIPSNTEDNSSKNVFGDIEHFVYFVKNKMINIPKGLSRYRIGTYDYIFEK